MLRVVDRIGDEPGDVLVREPVVDRCSLTAGLHQPSEAQLGQMLRDGRPRLADERRKLVDRQLTVDQQPQQLHSRRVREHPEHLDGEQCLLVVESFMLHICIHVQIVEHPGLPRPH
ncbi:hypothetical protein GALL_345540 [mine drainage metagenome]|uniref:Uncharacterized protein n=1 Tax=mine drainage metagenome TaxID=410659 RepID=A0A1J5QUT2_9ZZZZ